MKQFHFKVFLILLFTSMTSLSFSGNGKTYKLEYNLKKNESYKQNTQVDMKISQQVMGQNIDVRSTIDIETTHFVKDIDRDLITMDFVYDRIRSVVDAGGINQEMDSDTETSMASPTNMGPLYKAMIGIPVSVIMTKKGNVQSIKGVEKLSEAMMNSLENIDLPIGKEQITSQFTQQFNEASIKQLLERTTAYFPDKDVSIGDSWNIVMDMHDPYVLSVNMDMTLKEVEDNIAILEGKGDVSTPEGIISEEQGIQVKVNLKGTQSGIIKIDMNTGWTVSAVIIQEMVGESEVMGMKVPQSVKTIIKIMD